MCSDETRHAVFASRLHNLSHLQSCIFCLWNSLEFFGSTAVGDVDGWLLDARK